MLSNSVTHWYASLKPALGLDLGVSEKCVDTFSLDIWERFGKRYHSILKVDVAIVVVLIEFKILTWENFFKRFQIFLHLFASWFHPFFFLRKSYRWYICFMNDKTCYTSCCSKTYRGKSTVHPLYQKKQRFFFFLFFFFLLLSYAVTSDLPLLLPEDFFKSVW